MCKLVSPIIPFWWVATSAYIVLCAHITCCAGRCLWQWCAGRFRQQKTLPAFSVLLISCKQHATYIYKFSKTRGTDGGDQHLALQRYALPKIRLHRRPPEAPKLPAAFPRARNGNWLQHLKEPANSGATVFSASCIIEAASLMQLRQCFVEW